MLLPIRHRLSPYLKVVTHVSPEHYVMCSNYVLSVSAHVTQFVAKCMSDSGLLTLDSKIHDLCLQSERESGPTTQPCLANCEKLTAN